jgi:hypothetical protein
MNGRIISICFFVYLNLVLCSILFVYKGVEVAPDKKEGENKMKGQNIIYEI